MATIFKEKDDSANTGATLLEKKESASVDTENKQEAVPEEVAILKKQLSDAEQREKDERTKRIAAEKASGEAATKVVSTQNEAVKAHEASLSSALQVATGNITQIKRDLKDAIEGGDMDKQIELQGKLSEASWELKEVEKSKKQFDTWKEQQKNAPVQDNKPKYTASEQAWIDAHPRFNTDDDYYSVVAGADASARRKGIQPDTKAYYEHVENALKKSGLEDDGSANDNGRDTTGDVDDQEEEVAQVKKEKPKTSMPAAPASNLSPTSSNKQSAKSFKLTPEMRDMAHRMFGPNSSHKLSEKAAEEKYAAHQLDIRERRAAGERI